MISKDPLTFFTYSLKVNKPCWEDLTLPDVSNLTKGLSTWPKSSAILMTKYH